MTRRDSSASRARDMFQPPYTPPQSRTTASYISWANSTIGAAVGNSECGSTSVSGASKTRPLDETVVICFHRSASSELSR